MWMSSAVLKKKIKAHKMFYNVNEKDSCFEDLLKECTGAPPGARLSLSLRNRLEKFPLAARREMVNRLKEGRSPFFVACTKGQKGIAEYLIKECQPNLEQRGFFEVPDDR